MTDRDRFNKLSFLIAQVVQQMTELPPPSHGKCSCDVDGHCAHHATVLGHLLDAREYLERAQNQLRFPNGTGDRPAW